MRCFVLYLLMGQLWEAIYVVFAAIDWLWTGYGEAMERLWGGYGKLCMYYFRL